MKKSAKWMQAAALVLAVFVVVTAALPGSGYAAPAGGTDTGEGGEAASPSADSTDTPAVLPGDDATAVLPGDDATAVIPGDDTTAVIAAPSPDGVTLEAPGEDPESMLQSETTGDSPASSSTLSPLGGDIEPLTSADATIDLSDTTTPSGTGWTYSTPGAAGGVFTIADGAVVTVTGTTGTDSASNGARILIATGATATVTLDSATIDLSAAGSGAAIEVQGTLTLYLKGESTLKGGADYAGIQVLKGKTLNIYDGPDADTGTLNVTGGSNGAGIGGIYSSAVAGNLNFYSGIINATGGSGGAGIGGPYGKTGADTYGGTGGNVRIYGGTIFATGVGGGAGIGGGNTGGAGNGTPDRSDDIVIYGGYVTATGSSGAAGIGNGANSVENGNYNNTVIYGGTIAATGGNNAAGIGGGTGGNTSSVNISGGLITASGGVNGIGGGGGGYQGGSITISGGEIKTTSIGRGGAQGSGSTSISGTPTIYCTAIYPVASVSDTAIIFTKTFKDSSNTEVNVTSRPGIYVNTGVINLTAAGGGTQVTLPVGSDLTIPSGATLVVPDGVTIDMQGHDLTNYGVITKLGTGAIVHIGEGDDTDDSAGNTGLLYGTLSLTGTMGSGNTLTADVSDLSVYPEPEGNVTLAFQWQRYNLNGNGYTVIESNNNIGLLSLAAETGVDARAAEAAAPTSPPEEDDFEGDGDGAEDVDVSVVVEPLSGSIEALALEGSGSNTYTQIAADDGHSIGVLVTATDGQGHTYSGLLAIAKAKATVTTPPTAADDLTYTGEALALLDTPGAVSTGSMVYKLGESGYWLPSIPSAALAGTYTIYYKAQGTNIYAESDEGQLTVTISGGTVSSGTTINLSDSITAGGDGWTYSTPGSPGGVFSITNGAVVTVTGSTGTGAASNGNHIQVASNATATITLDNATIDLSAVVVTADNPATIADDTGYLNASPIDVEGTATIYLKGSNILKGGPNWAGIYVPNGKTANIADAPSGTGTLTATGGTGGAGIGGSSGGTTWGGTMNISGGTITATGGTGGAGIGGGTSGNSGTINVSGGSINAAGTGGGAGIGGGTGGGCRPGVTISGGIVVATGSSNSSGGAAGIGGGYGNTDASRYGIITISGGTITAIPASSGVGAIGVGTSSNAGPITITGGNINAVGYIGGNSGWGQPTALTITGGVIRAQSIGAQAGANVLISGNPTIYCSGYIRTVNTLSGNPVVFAYAMTLGSGITSNPSADDGIYVSTGVTNLTTAGGGTQVTLPVTSDFTVPAGGQLVVPDGVTIDMNNKNLTKNGTVALLGSGEIVHVGAESAQDTSDDYAGILSGTLTIDGVLGTGNTLTASVPDATTAPVDSGNLTLHYRWLRYALDGKTAEETGLDQPTYLLTGDDVNRSIGVIVTATGNDGSYYGLTGSVQAKILVNTPPTPATLTYSQGTQQDLLATLGSVENGTLQYKLGAAGTYDTVSPTGSQIGAYNVIYQVVGVPNYLDSDEVTIQAKINPAAPVGDDTIDVSDDTRPYGTGWTYAGGVFTVANGANVKVIGTTGPVVGTSGNRIVIAANATATLTLDDVLMDSTGIPIDVGAGATLTLLVKNENTLTGAGNAVIRVPQTATLNVDSATTTGSEEGTLNVTPTKYTAIGNQAAYAGTMNFYGATVVAKATSSASAGSKPSGIGAGGSGWVAINIYGGNITAKGGGYQGNSGSGLGGGNCDGSITIYGGTVSAKNGQWGGDSSILPSISAKNIVIYGGTVTAAQGYMGIGISTNGAARNATTPTTGTLAIHGGTVIASAAGWTEVVETMAGVVAGTLIIDGGTLVATGKGGDHGGAFYAQNVTVDGDAVIMARGGDVNATGTMNLNGGTVYFPALGTIGSINLDKSVVIYSGTNETLGTDNTQGILNNPTWSLPTVKATGSLTIPEGKTLIVPDGYTLDMNYNILTNNGDIALIGTGRIINQGDGSSDTSTYETNTITGGVWITGTVAIGQTLSARTSSVVLNPAGGTLHYQWQRYGTDGAFEANIGDGSATYEVQDADVGKPIGLVVTAKTPGEDDYYGSLLYIMKATPALTAPVSAAPVYNTQAQELVTGGAVTGGTLWYKLGSTGTYSTDIPTATAVGSYTVYYKVVGNTNYNDIAEKTVAVSIAKAPGATVAAPTVATNTATSITLNAVEAPANGQVVEYAKNTSSSLPGSGWQTSTTFSGLTANTSYYFFARSKSDTSYNAGTAASLQVTTAKATLTGTATITGSTVYGETLSISSILSSTPSVTLGTTSYAWKRSGSDTVIGTNATYTLGAADIGHTITVTLTTANTQSSVSAAATAQVTARKITGAWSVSGSKTYDGTTALSGVTVTFTPGNLVAGDTADVVIGFTAAFAAKEAGAAKAINVTDIGLTGSKASCYLAPDGPATTLTRDVAKRGLTISYTLAEKYYDGKTTISYTTNPALVGVQNSEAITLSGGTPSLGGAGSSESDTLVPVSFTTFTISGTTTANYDLAQPSGVSVTVKKNAVPTQGTQYTTTALTSGWTNGTYAVTAKSGYKVSTGSADGSSWQDALTYPNETASGTQVTFHVRETATGRISPTVTVSYGVDQTNPTATITVKGNTFATFLNTITFGLFFKETVSISIASADTGSATANSGVLKTEYILMEAEGGSALPSGIALSLDSGTPSASGMTVVGGWTTGTSLSKAPSWKGLVVARVTDVAGNVAYACTGGIVLYADSTRSGGGTLSFTRTTSGTVAFGVTLNGNTIDTVKNDAVALSAGTDYTVSENGEVATITLTNSYLSTLAAGGYTITVEVFPLGQDYEYASGNGNEAPSAVTADLTVVKAVPVVTAPTPKTLTYTGSAQALVNAGATTGGTLQYAVVIKGDGAPASDKYAATIPTKTAAGDYTVYYRVVGNDYYQDKAAQSLDVTIAKAAPAVTAPTARSLTYNTAAQALVNAGSTADGTLKYAAVLRNADAPDTGAYTTDIPQKTTAGDYTVYYFVAGDSNHTDSAPASVNVTIARAGQAAIVISVDSAPGGDPPTAYDATATVTLSGGSGTGAWSLVSSDTSVATVEGSGMSWTVHVIKASGSYKLTATKAQDQNYNAQTGATNEVAAGRTAQAALNYIGSPPTVYGTNASFTISGGSGTGVYTLTSSAPDVASVQAVSAAAGTFTVTVLKADGSYVLTYGRAGDDSYNEKTEAIAETATVKAQQASVAITGTLPTVYGDEQALTVSGGTGNGAYTLTSNSASVTVTPDTSGGGAAAGRFLVHVVSGSGSYQLTYGRSGDEGHEDATTATTASKTVTKRKLTGAWSVNGSKTYDGTTALTGDVTVGFTPSNKVNGDDVAVTFTAAFANKAASTAQNVTVTGIGLSGAAAANYTAPDGPTDQLTAQIAKRKLAGAWAVSGEKTYDATTDVTGKGTLSVTFTPSNKVDGDTATLSFTPAFTSAEAGSHAVHVSGLALSGGDAANYDLPDVPASAGSASIAKRVLTLTVVAGNKNYDGTAAATLTSATLANLAPGQTQGTEVTLSYTYSGDSATFGAGGASSGTPSAAFAGVGTPAADTQYDVTLGTFTLGGTKGTNYTLTAPAAPKAKILAGFTAVKNTHYTATALNGAGWTNAAGGFTVTAADGNLVSLSAAVDGGEGGWAQSLTWADDTAAGSAAFYVKNAAGQISKQQTEAYKLDRTAPTLSITIKDSSFYSFLSTITFGLFFNASQSVTLAADDVGSVQSGKAGVGYYMVSSVALPESTDWTSVSWHDYAIAFPLDAGFKGYVYARVLDGAGNETVVRSDGVVVYTNAHSSASVSYVKGTGSDVTFSVNLEGNSLKWVALYEGGQESALIGKTESQLASDGVTLTQMAMGTAYEFAMSGDDVATITLKADWLESLSAGGAGASASRIYGVVVSVNPGGETYQAASGNDEPLTVPVPLTVSKAAASLTWPTPSGITYGDDLNDSSLASGGASSGRADGGGFSWADGNDEPTVAEGAAGLDCVFTPTAAQAEAYDWASLGGADGVEYDADTGVLTKSLAVSVAKRTLTGSWAVTGKTYDGTAVADVTFTPDNVVAANADAATAYFTAAYGSASAGVDKPVTVTFVNTGVQGAGLANYLPPAAPLDLKATVAKAQVQGVTLSRSVQKDAEEDAEARSLSGLLPGLESPRTLGAVSYQVTVVSDEDGLLSGTPVAADGALSLPLAATLGAVEGQTATVTVAVASTNYEDYTVTVTVKIAGAVPRILTQPVSVGGNPPVYTDDGDVAGTTADDVAVLSAEVRSSSDLDFVWMVKVGDEIDAEDGSTESDDVPAAGDAAEISGSDLAPGDDHVLTYHPPTDVAGSVTYYCLFTNDAGSLATDAATVTVTARDFSAQVSSPSSSWTFTDVTYGYDELQTQGFVLTSSGNQDLMGLEAALGAGDGSAFEAVVADAGQPRAIASTEVAAGGSWTVTVRPKAGLAAGSHTDTLTFSWDVITGTGSGAVATTATVVANLSVTVNQKANTLTLALPPDDRDGNADDVYTYYAGAYTPQVVANEAASDASQPLTDGVSFEWRIADQEPADTYKPGLPTAASAAGQIYQVHAKSEATNNYSARTSSSVRFRIEKAPLQVTAVAADKPYDGLYAAVLSSASLDGLQGGQVQGTDVTLTYTNGQDTAEFGAGGALSSGTASATFSGLGSPASDTSYSVNIGTFAFGGPQAANYTLTQPTAPTAKILAASFTATKSVHYSITTALNGSGWTNAPGGFALAAEGTWLLSTSSAANGGANGWTTSLSAGSDTGSGSLTVYAKDPSTGAISKAGTVPYKLDRALPTAEISVEGNAFRTFLNAITFGYFFKDTVSVSVIASDALSGVGTVEVLRLDGVDADTELRIENGELKIDDSVAAEWALDDEIFVSAGWKGAVVARVTDVAGNVSFVSSDGLVVYEDSVTSASVAYTRTTKTDQTVGLTLNGNAIGDVNIVSGEHSSPLRLDQDYSVSGGTITLDGDWLDTLDAGDYTLLISVLPLGEDYAPAGGALNQDAPAELSVGLTVDKATPAISSLAANGGAALAYGHLLSSWSITGTATGPAGAVGGAFSWHDGSSIPGDDDSSAANGLAGSGYACGLTWTPSSADGSYGAGKASDYFKAVTDLSAQVYVDPAAPATSPAGSRPQGTPVLTGMNLASSTLSGGVAFAYAGEGSGSKAVPGAWHWDTDGDGIPDEEDAAQAGSVDKAADHYCNTAGHVSPKPKAVYIAEHSGAADRRFSPLVAEVDVIVFSPMTVIVAPGSYTIQGTYGRTLGDVFAGAAGDTNAEKADNALKALGFRAVAADGVSHGAVQANLQAYIDDPACDITARGTFGWQDYLTVLNAGASQDATIVFTPSEEYLLTDEELDDPSFEFDPAAPKYAKNAMAVTVSLGQAALSGSVGIAGTATYGGTITAAAQGHVVTTPDIIGGAWPGALGALTYTWQRADAKPGGDYQEGDWTTVAAASGTGDAYAAYTLGSDDTDKAVRVVVTAQHASGSAASAAVEVGKASASVSAAPAAAPGLVYDGSEQALITAGTATGGVLMYKLGAEGSYSEGIPVAVDAGTYTVYYKVFGDADHNDTVAVGVNVTIGKADAAVTLAPAAVNGLAYTGSAQALVTAGTADGGTVQYRLGAGGAYAEAVPAAVNADSYEVFWKVAGDSNHKDTAEASLSITIARVPASVTAPGAAAGLVYTGAPLALVTAGSAEGGTILYAAVMSGGGAPSDGDYAASVPVATAAGDYLVYYRVAGDGNHTDVAADSVAVSIGAATPVVTAPVALDGLVYTGAPLALVSAGSATGGTVAYALTGASDGAPADGAYAAPVPSATGAGSYLVWYKVAGDANYTDVAAASVPVTIAKKPQAAVTLSGTLPSVYGQTETLTLSGGDAGDYTLVSSDTSKAVVTADGAAGSFDVEVTGSSGSYTLTWGRAGDDNHLAYSETSAAVTLGKAASSVTASPPGAVGLSWTGAAQALLSGGGTASGGTMVYRVGTSGEFSATLPSASDAGDYTVYYKVQGDANHNDTAPLSLVVSIAKVNAVLTAPPSAVSGLVYEAAPLALVTAGTATGGTVQYKVGSGGSYSNALPTGTDAGSFDVYWRVAGDGNHFDVAEAGPLSVSIAAPDTAQLALEVTLDEPVFDLIVLEDALHDDAGSHMGLHEDDYDEGAVAAFIEAYEIALYLKAGFAGDSTFAGQSAVDAARAALESALAGLKFQNGHPLAAPPVFGGTAVSNAGGSGGLGSAAGSAADGAKGVSGHVVVTKPEAGDLAYEFQGHMPHVERVTIAGPGNTPERTLWELATDGSGTMDFADKDLYDGADRAGTLTSGSAVVTLSADYLAGLADGAYTVSIAFTDAAVAAAVSDSPEDQAVRAMASRAILFEIGREADDVGSNGGSGGSSGSGGGSNGGSGSSGDGSGTGADDGTGSGAGSASGASGGSGASASGSNAAASGTAKTGDAFDPMTWALLTALAALALLTIARRRLSKR
jgi:hypothetical protein